MTNGTIAYEDLFYSFFPSILNAPSFSAPWEALRGPPKGLSDVIQTVSRSRPSQHHSGLHFRAPSIWPLQPLSWFSWIPFAWLFNNFDTPSLPMLREVGQNNEGLRRVSDGVRSIGGPRECYLRNDGGECFWAPARNAIYFPGGTDWTEIHRHGDSKAVKMEWSPGFAFSFLFFFSPIFHFSVCVSFFFSFIFFIL